MTPRSLNHIHARPKLQAVKRRSVQRYLFALFVFLDLRYRLPAPVAVQLDGGSGALREGQRALEEEASDVVNVDPQSWPQADSLFCQLLPGIAWDLFI